MSDSDRDRSWTAAGIDARALSALTRELSASELWSLLLTVLEQRAAQRTPSELAQQWRSDRFVAPALADQRTLMAIDLELLAAAAQFESIELSPLAPLGGCSVVAPTSQNRVVSSARGSEIVSDPTNVLALESARRLQDDPQQVVRLATSHRCLRAQSIPKVPGFAAHFRMFCLTTAGRETADQQFTVATLSTHIRVHLHGLDRLQRLGYAFPDRIVTLLSTPQRAALAQRIEQELGGVRVRHEPLEHGYYFGLRFKIDAASAPGAAIPLIDGGAFDWVAQLTANRKNVYVASAIGSQLIALAFRR
jgi:hypothetical protein